MLAGAMISMLSAAAPAATFNLHAVGGNCSAADPAQQGWQFDSADDTIKFHLQSGAASVVSRSRQTGAPSLSS